MAGVMAKAKRDVKVDHLRKLPLFDGLSDQQLARVAGLADEVAVPPGYVLVHEGAFGHEVFVLAEGEAEVAAEGGSLQCSGPARWWEKWRYWTRAAERRRWQLSPLCGCSCSRAGPS